jgi:hypothetical protein
MPKAEYDGHTLVEVAWTQDGQSCSDQVEVDTYETARRDTLDPPVCG